LSNVAVAVDRGGKSFIRSDCCKESTIGMLLNFYLDIETRAEHQSFFFLRNKEKHNISLFVQSNFV
jgi:hypothetical protein